MNQLLVRAALRVLLGQPGRPAIVAGPLPASALSDEEAAAREIAASEHGLTVVQPTGSGVLAGKVAFVTGAAQGFGLGIANDLHAEGAHVVFADRNLPGAQRAAEALGERALALEIDVTREESVARAIHDAVTAWGGIDLLVSNAGVLKAESVKTQPATDFEFVSRVNTMGYFLLVKHAAPIMAMTHRMDPNLLTDIIQINSKSGLQGSNRNAAYASSKFAGIGLTQSFALELLEDGIKVNSICPGNYFEGPLWMDAETGLFVQYLRSGKVPGAQTLEDVRRFYESKIPMGRGCQVADVVRAIRYLVEQQYETGQALPVTGGQVMLS